MLIETKARTTKDVPAETLTIRLADHLKAKNLIETPAWIDYAKTASFKEMPPKNPDWLYMRAASVMRKLYEKPNIGVGEFRRIYGGRSRKRMTKRHFKKASAGLIRYVLHQLEKAKLVKKVMSGRRITKQGQSLIDSVSSQIKVVVPQIFLDIQIDEKVEMELEDEELSEPISENENEEDAETMSEGQ